MDHPLDRRCVVFAEPMAIARTMAIFHRQDSDATVLFMTVNLPCTSNQKPVMATIQKSGHITLANAFACC